MSKKISEISPGSIVWFNTTLSGTDKSTPFIVLGQSQSGDSILLLQKYLYEKRSYNSSSVTQNTTVYKGSQIDNYLSAEITESDNYRSKLSEIIRNCLITTNIESYYYTGPKDGAILKIPRDIFLMSYLEAGLITDSWYAIEGVSYIDALKIATNTTTDDTARIATAESNTESNWLLRSTGLTTGVGLVFLNGTLGSNSPNPPQYIRPVISVSPATLIDDSSSTLTVIGLPNTLIDISISLGQSTNRPIKAKAIVDIQNADSHTIQITNNYKDTNPVWVTADSNNCAELTNTTKTTDKWELGLKIQTEATEPNTVVSEPKLIVVTE